MKLPNKVVSYKSSILPKLAIILEALEDGAKTPTELYKKVNKKVENIAEFTSILDCLFALGKIEMLNEEVLHFVKRNQM
jgi:hypothetical protein